MLRSSIWVTLSIILGRGSVILTGILLANQLGALAFAIYTFIHITATSISGFATFGMQNILPRYFARLSLDDSQNHASLAALSFTLSGGGLLLAALCVALIPSELIGLHDPDHKMYVISLLVLISVNNLLIGASNGLEKFKDVTLSTLAQGAIILCGAFSAVYMMRVEVALWAYMLATITSITMLLRAVLSHFISAFQNHRHIISLPLLREVINFGGPLFLCTVLFNTGIWLSGRTLLGHGDNSHEFAEFALGMQWFGMASLMPAVIGRVVLPRITRLGYKQDEIGNIRTIRHGIAMSLGATLIFFLVVLVFSDAILSLYGEEMASANLVLVIFVAAAVIASPSDIIASGLMSINKPMAVLYNMLLWWACLIMLLFVLSDMNSLGVVVALFIAYILSTTAMIFSARYNKLI